MNIFQSKGLANQKSILAMIAPNILHLPHASTFMPEDLRDDFLLSDEKLLDELTGSLITQQT